MNSPDLLQLFVAAAIMGGITAYLAKRRGRDPAKWFIVGFLAGIFWSDSTLYVSAARA